MNSLHIMAQKEQIAGLELQDRILRLALFEQAKDHTTALVTAVERPLPEGIIENGVVKDTAALTRELETLLKKADRKIRYVVAAIPTVICYVKTLSFPQVIQGKKLEETMALTIGFQLPIKQQDSYVHWSRLENTDANEILLMAAKRSVIDDYIIAMTAAKISPVAIEPAAIAIARRIETPGSDTVMLLDTTSTPHVFSFCVLRDHIVRFIHHMPASPEPKAAEAEARKLASFYEVEYKQPVTITIEQDTAKDHEPDITGSESRQGCWLAAYGAAQRGAIPRDRDMLASLMPIGTAEAYRRQKAIAFVELLSNMTIGISIFFMIAFIGVWLLLLALRQQTATRMQSLDALPADPDTVALETRARAMNTTLAVARDTITQIPRWSSVVEELKVRIPAGITVTNLMLPAPEDTLSITGVAQDRTQLNAFKKQMEESRMFTNVTIPPANLELRMNIPFTLSFTLSDPKSISSN